MSQILKGCSSVIFYIDDITVVSKTKQEHLTNLAAVLRRIKAVGLQLNRNCNFYVELSFLGHRVTAQGISPLPKKVDSILNTPAPTDGASLRSFLSLVKYYTQFVSSLAGVIDPMRTLLCKNEPFIWSDAVDASFQKFLLYPAKYFTCLIPLFRWLSPWMLLTAALVPGTHSRLSISHTVPNREEVCSW